MKNDGGPAFPLKNYTKEVGPDTAGFMAKDAFGESFWINSGSPGMSLRDWFAGMSFPAINAFLSDIGREGVITLPKHIDSAVIASMAYDIADAMLAERAKGDTDV